MDDRPWATANVIRWLHQQMAQHTLDREHIEAAIERGDAAEVRRLLARHEFTDEQRRYIDDLLRRWEDALG